ncbi:hypothetical protein LMG26689_01877 [Achromobacter animicus]|nr:hypothetical protein LMG26689_01877 [Achromobacter animicus]
MSATLQVTEEPLSDEDILLLRHGADFAWRRPQKS